MRAGSKFGMGYLAILKLMHNCILLLFNCKLALSLIYNAIHLFNSEDISRNIKMMSRQQQVQQPTKLSFVGFEGVQAFDSFYQ